MSPVWDGANTHTLSEKKYSVNSGYFYLGKEVTSDNKHFIFSSSLPLRFSVSKTEDGAPPAPPHLRSGPNDARDEATQLVAPGPEGRQVHLEQVSGLVRGVQLLVEVQHLLLQGVEAAQADLALLLPEPRQLRLPQALLLCLPQLQVENLRRGPSSYSSLRGSWALFLHS